MRTEAERRAYIEGLGVAVKRIREYATELFLRDLGEVEAVRLRDLAIELDLHGAEVLRGPAEAKPCSGTTMNMVGGQCRKCDYQPVVGGDLKGLPPTHVPTWTPKEAKIPVVVQCQTCNDTGVEETGSNDLPCACPAGDTAKFSVCTRGGVKEFTGGQLKRGEDRL